MFRRLISRFFDLAGKMRPEGGRLCRSELSTETVHGVTRRVYSGGYSEYLSHQGSKLDRTYGRILESDRAYEKIVLERFAGRAESLRGRTVLCLGARLGGEVRAFISLGALAVGVDINPGPRNPHVLYGDFHALVFGDGSFDFVFTNAFDHVYDVEKFASEAARVLKPSGILFLECSQAALNPEKFEVIDTLDSGIVATVFGGFFDIKDSVPITNRTSYINWSGNLVTLEKKAGAVGGPR